MRGRLGEECPRCGEVWYPSRYESETFPGSRCDDGECWCIYCPYDGCEDDCPRLARKRWMGEE